MYFSIKLDEIEINFLLFLFIVLLSLSHLLLCLSCSFAIVVHLSSIKILQIITTIPVELTFQSSENPCHSLYNLKSEVAENIIHQYTQSQMVPPPHINSRRKMMSWVQLPLGCAYHLSFKNNNPFKESNFHTQTYKHKVHST